MVMRLVSSLLGGYTNDTSTDDWAYGADGARALASSNWEAAVDNAENYEHFASHAYLMRILPALL